MPKQVVLEFPVEFPGKSVQDKEALRKAKESMVLELLRKREISQGKAAELLGIDRNTLFDLMAEHNIPMANFPPEELERQREDDEKREKVKK
ncbi:MAG: UPF0175 family protein [Planctomycetia bacterium]|nr:UPF0175 family protein [Planctomycetia bacterium]